MRAYVLEHLADDDLLRALAGLVAHERCTTATLLAHIAEVDARRLYLPAGHSSMYAYCIDDLRLSEDAAYKRIRVARAARRFPAIFEALADGRLNLSAIVLLVPHLTQGNSGELIGAASGKGKSEVEEMLARRFPRSEPLGMEQMIPAAGTRSDVQLAPGPVGGGSVRPEEDASGARSAPNADGATRPRTTPISADRFAIQLTVDRSTRDKLNYARELLSHSIPSGDLAAVVDRALDVLIGRLEKRKLAATRRPRSPRTRSTRPRTVPADVRRLVWARDEGRCTFVGATGRRCAASAFLEFDHVVPVARGGRSTVDGLRLRCRAHNQYRAERAFGAEFMAEKRRLASSERGVAGGRRGAGDERSLGERRPTGDKGSPVAGGAESPTDVRSRDLTACLQSLGFRVQEIRRAAESREVTGPASLEERVRAALRLLCPKARTVTSGPPQNSR
jgi:5-methylcytosine-specific restriction endonuclease McrA